MLNQIDMCIKMGRVIIAKFYNVKNIIFNKKYDRMIYGAQKHICTDNNIIIIIISL